MGNRNSPRLFDATLTIQNVSNVHIMVMSRLKNLRFTEILFSTSLAIKARRKKKRSLVL